MQAPATSGGALKREIGVLGVASVTINIIMGSGLFVVPALMGVVGAWAPGVIALCALVMGAVALCFAEASSRVPQAGGVYGFVREAMGPMAGTAVGGMVWLSGTLAAAGILAAAIDQLAPFAPVMGQPVARAVSIVGFCTLAAFMALRGARQSARAIEVTMALKLTPLVLFIVFVAFTPAAPAPPPATVTAATIGPLLILGIYLCAGLEGATVMNGEVRDPTRTVPAGLFAALGVFAAVAIAIQLAAGHALGAELATSKAPLVAAAARVGPWLPPVMAVGAIVSMLGCAAGLAVANPRTLYALATDGYLPGALARVHPTRGTPTIAIVLQAVIVASMAIAGEFRPLTIAASLASMACYVFGCIAVLVLRRRGIQQMGNVTAWRITPVAAVVAIAANLAIIGSAKGPEIGALAIALALSASLGLLPRRAAMVRAA